jgi:HEAT repeat protein
VRSRHGLAGGYSVDAIVAGPHGFDIFDRSFRTFCADHATELLPRLKHEVSTRPPRQQVAIARLLTECGDGSAGDILLDLLETGDIEAQRQVIIALRTRNIGRDLAAPIDETRALHLLRPWLQAAETLWRKNAAELLFGLKLPEARDIKLAMLTDASIPLRMAAATALARDGDPLAWPVLRDILLGKGDELRRERYFAIGSLKDLAKSHDEGLRQDIARFAARQIETQLDHDDNTTANEVWNLLAVIEAAAPSWEAMFLETVIASRLMAWPRGAALGRLAKLQGIAILPRLSVTLDDPELTPYALHALGDLGRQAATADTIEGIRRLIIDTDSARIATAAADALTALGHGDDPVLVKYAAKLDPWSRFAVSVRVKNVGADAFLALLQDAGVIDGARLAEAGTETLETFRAAWRARKEGTALSELLMRSQAVHWFDTENDRVPPNYVELLTRFAELARSRFNIEKISMRGTDEDGREATQHEIWLLFDGRPVRILVKDLGDWFDVGGLLGQLNTEIAASGKPDRFLTLHSDDQSAQVVLGNATKLLALRRKYDFPVADDPDAPVHTGQEYERRVLAEMGKGKR